MAKELPPDGYEDDELPPDGFEDNQPPDGFEEDQSTVGKIKAGAKKVGKAALKGITIAGEAIDDAKDRTGYRFSPQGLAEEGLNFVNKVAGKAGEFVAEETAREGMNPYVSAGLGTVVAMGPDIAMAGAEPSGTMERAIGKVDDAARGLTAAGEAISGRVAKAEAIAPMADNVIKLPTGQVKVIDTARLPQVIQDKLAYSKEVATKLETKATKAIGDLDELEKGGADGLTISAQEEEWLGRVAELKQEHGQLTKQVQEGLFQSNLEQRPPSYVKRLDELRVRKETLLKQHETVALTPQQEDLLARIDAKRSEFAKKHSEINTPRLSDLHTEGFRDMGHSPTPKAAVTLEVKMNKLDELRTRAIKRFEEQLQQRRVKLANEIQKVEVQSKELGRELGTAREQNLFKMQDKAKALEQQVKLIETKYSMQRMAKFNKQKDKLTEIAAYAENDLREIGFTSKDIENGFLHFVKGTPAGGKLVSAAEKGNVISKDLYDGVMNAPDLTGFDARAGQLTTNIDQLDRTANGAFRREVLQPAYNKHIQYHEVKEHFLRKMKDLMDGNELKPEDTDAFRRYVEGKTEAPAGRAAAFGKAKDQMRAITDELLDLRNAFRKERGEALIPRRDDYITSISKELLADDLYIPAEELLELGKMKKGTAKFGYDQKRFDLIPESERLGAFEAIQMYAVKTAKEVSFTSEIEKMRALAEVARNSNKANMARYFESVADRLTGDAFKAGSQWVTNNVVSREWLQKAFQLNANFAENVVGQFGAAVNQVASAVLASKDIGVGRALGAIPEGFGRELVEQVVKAHVNPTYADFATQHSKVIRMTVGKEIERALKISDDPGLLHNRQLRLWFFRTMNDSMLKGTFNQAYRAARVSGKPHSLAVKVADDIVARSQGIYEDAFRPALIGSGNPIAQLVAPLQTYVFNTMNVLKNDVWFSKLTPTQKVAATTRMFATGTLVNLGVALATGGKTSMQPTDAIPFYRLAQIGASGIFGPAAKFVKGDMTGAAEAAFLASGPGRSLGGLQTLKTIKGAKQLLEGKTTDPRVLVFGPKAKGK